MADLQETRTAYNEACAALSIQPHALVISRLNEEAIRQQSHIAATMCLNLAGNNLEGTRLTDVDIQALCSCLSHNYFITGLDLRYNRCTNLGAKALGELLQVNTAITALDLMNNDIGEEGARYLCEGLKDNQALKLLKLNGNKIGNKGAMHLASLLQINVCLESLDLNDSDVGMEALIAFATVMRQNRFIRVLNLSRPILFSHQEETTVHMGLMLRTNTCLKELHLMKCDMRDFGAERIADGLCENNTLTYLNLACNRITRDGTRHLARVLLRNTTLEVLELGQNRLEDVGAKYLAEALQNNFSLKMLSIPDNQIKEAGLCALAETLDGLNSSLQCLYIWGNELTERACVAFNRLLNITCRLEMDNVDIRPFEVDGHVKLCELNHGPRKYYYYTPFFGADALALENPLIAQSTMSPAKPVALY